MKKLPIGIQSIKKILSNNEYVYVDKTEFIKKLIEEGAPHYFLSRPRRFGKSLFLNTIEEIFKGNKELFKECKIHESDYKWQKHPVLHFNFAQVESGTPEQFENDLKETLQEVASTHKISITGPSIKPQLRKLIPELAKGARVVVLVDEYDHPIINHLNDPQVAEKNRDILKSFFETLKNLDRYLKFTFITGVSKFSQVSLFSGYNNLKDITMDPRYSGMMGYTSEELKNSFKEYIHAIAKERSHEGVPTKEDDILEEVRTWYNGYRFSRGDTCVYNPFSTLNFMDEKEAQSYWYSTGTPSFLIDQVKAHPQSIVPLTGITASKAQLMDISSVDEIDLAALMFQTGYLTIGRYEPVTKRYHLDFPNQEVTEAFLETLVTHFAKINATISTTCQESLENQRLTPFFDQMKATLSSFPYQLFVKAAESTYHGILLGILKGMGLEVHGEKITNLGRIDLVIEVQKTTYIIELKLDSNPNTALEQVEQKKYHEQYLHREKEIAVIGVNFSSQSRNIDGWKGRLFSPSGDVIKDLLPNSKS